MADSKGLVAATRQDYAPSHWLPIPAPRGAPMQRLIVGLLGVLAAALCVAPAIAEAGCRCGNSYISELKTCHKCTCECPSCDYRNCAIPELRFTPRALRITPAGSTSAAHEPAPGEADSQTVIFNKESGAIHKQGCPAAKRCTRNCILLAKAEAIKRGGRPCGICRR